MSVNFPLYSSTNGSEKQYSQTASSINEVNVPFSSIVPLPLKIPSCVLGVFSGRKFCDCSTGSSENSFLLPGRKNFFQALVRNILSFLQLQGILNLFSVPLSLAIPRVGTPQCSKSHFNQFTLKRKHWEPHQLGATF